MSHVSPPSSAYRCPTKRKTPKTQDCALNNGRSMGSPSSGSNSPFASRRGAVGVRTGREGSGGGGNQSRMPQDGHGASPGGREGSSRRSWPQTGQRFQSPSGVRDAMFMGFIEPRLRRRSRRNSKAGISEAIGCPGSGRQGGLPGGCAQRRVNRYNKGVFPSPAPKGGVKGHGDRRKQARVDHRLRQGPRHRAGQPAQPRRAAPPRRQLAGDPVHGPRHDLPQGQPPAARAPPGRAHQEAPATTRGRSPTS
jgi:hypothetical protein